MAMRGDGEKERGSGAGKYLCGPYREMFKVKVMVSIVMFEMRSDFRGMHFGWIEFSCRRLVKGVLWLERMGLFTLEYEK